MACAEGASEKFRVFCMTAADGVTFCKFQGGGGQVPPPPAGAHAYKMRTRLKCVRIKLHEVMTACPHSWKGCYATFAVTPNHPQLLLNEWGGVIDKREGTSKKWQKNAKYHLFVYHHVGALVKLLLFIAFKLVTRTKFRQSHSPEFVTEWKIVG